MGAFLEEYGKIIVVVIVVAALIVIASIFKKKTQDDATSQLNNFNNLATNAVTQAQAENAQAMK